ncbi:MAG: hypothetical protein ACJ75B_14230 [Flavisolibacter sp.]
MSNIYTCLFLVILVSCGTRIDYVGKSATPTQKVDVFVDPSSIKKPYTVIGKGYVTYGAAYRMEKLQRQAVQKAKEKGADAVLFQDYFVTEEGTNSYASHHSDSSQILVNVHNARDLVSTHTDVLFLKYN